MARDETRAIVRRRLISSVPAVTFWSLTMKDSPKLKRRWYQFSLLTEDVVKRLTTWMLPIALLLVFGTPTYSAERESGQEASEDAAPKPDPRIAKWILQLDNEEFNVREQAQQALIKAGLKALPAVLKATQSKQPEVRNRAFGILFAMSQSDDPATANAVLTAVEEILKSPDRRRMAQARRIHKRILKYRGGRAIQVLLKLGARFDRPDGAQAGGTVRFSRDWPDSVYLTGTPVTDDHMVHLKELTNLETLYLNNTKITDAGRV